MKKTGKLQVDGFFGETQAKKEKNFFFLKRKIQNLWKFRIKSIDVL